MESSGQNLPTPTNLPAARQPGAPYREDCWSDGETAALVDAWGERYLELNRGSLRQKQWQEVADAVNSRRQLLRRKIRTDVQCKNRIDTLKKKFKQEKAKIVEGTALTSQWPFYSRLEVLIGSGSGSGSGGSASGGGVRRIAAALPAGSPFAGVRRSAGLPQSPSPPLALPLPLRIGNKPPSALPVATRVDDSFIRKAAAAAAAAAGASSFPIASSFIRKAPPHLPRVDSSFIRKTPPPLPHVDSSFIRKTPPHLTPPATSAPPPAMSAPPPATSAPPSADNYFIRKAVAAAAAAKQESMDNQEDQESEQSEESEKSEESIRSVSSSGAKRGRKRKAGSSSDGIVQLAKAIDKMGQMYERIEEARQKEMVEMEKQRMEMIKRMELQRMQMFADLKVQTERMRRANGSSPAGELVGTISAVSFLMNPSLI